MGVSLEEMVAACRPYTRQGQLPGYIPALKQGDPSRLGACLLSCDGRLSQAGDWDVSFSIQSIVKPILLLQALLDNGVDTVRSHVGVEATGKPFDAINYTDQVLDSQHLNPMVNMGAIADVDAMLLAGKRANALGIPVVLDPVAAGASALRRRWTITVKFCKNRRRNLWNFFAGYRIWCFLKMRSPV